jgi:hypothetical protein
MDILGQYLDARTEQAAGRIAFSPGLPPEERLPAFDRWVRHQLAARIDWTWAGDEAAKLKRIEQARAYLERIVLGLWRRGWMLDGRRLADHLTCCLNAIGHYQRSGKVRDFWPYFQTSVDRYVGLNADSIKEEAMSAGSHISQITTALLKATASPAQPLPALLAQRAAEAGDAKAETLRGRLARQRARNAACKADAQQPQLF